MKVIQNLIIFFLLFLILNSKFYISAVSAIESTPSSEIKNKLEELKREIASKAAKLKGEVNRKLTNKAYVGTLKTKSSNSLTLASSTGPKLVTINQDTLLPKKSLAEENYIAALGDVDETGVLTAKKIILLPQPKAGQPLAEKTYIRGQVVSVSERLVTLKDRNLKNFALSISTGTKVKLNDFIIATGAKGKNEIFKAEFVHVATKSATTR